MIDVREAVRLVAQQGRPLEPCERPLREAVGRVLREVVRADRDQPPFDRVTMDGFAFSSTDLVAGGRRLRRQAVQAAGHARLELRAGGCCIEVMTGAVLPAGCDTVVRFEDVTADGDEVVLADGVSPAPLQNVHRQGSDGRAGDVAIAPGVRLTPAHVGIAAAMGKSALMVSEVPRIAVVSTGDELVDVAVQPAPHQVRRSNVYAIDAALALHGYGDNLLCHLADDRVALERELAALLDRCDTLILSGGVSMGKFDFVPEVLDCLGVDRHFHKVRQRPGKPLWFGTRAGKAIFALPGNPVSSLVCLYRYVLPYLDRCSAATAPPTAAVRLAAPASGLRALTRFLPVALVRSERGQSRAEGGGEVALTALPVENNTSGDFLSLGRSDGFVEIDEGAGRLEAGTKLSFYPWAPAAAMEARC